MTLDTFVDVALSVPFVIGGRSYRGWDCWGLIYVAYRDVFDIELNRLSDEYDAKLSYSEISSLIDREKPEWISVEKPVPGAVSLYRVGRYQTHVSLVLDRRRMIHCEQIAGTLCERLDTVIWAKRHVGYFTRNG